ncbi:hypothetical protein AGMMS49942_01200 [Spirochaetia bacterium]|nr:hypothetical protein AGMMS49942_01200 [Spirochaetia bacterium]
MASTIGIKVANGEFYPILEESSPVKKRLILTTAHDNQKSAQIDLYNSSAKTMADALYAGSLVVENIKAQPKGAPSLELILASGAAGELSADIVDLGSPKGSHQHLSVSLPSLEEEESGGEIPDFELEPPSPRELHPPSGLYEKAETVEVEVKQKRFPWLLVAAAAVLLVVVCGLLYFLFLGDKGMAPRTASPASPAPVVPAATPVPPAPPPPPPVVPVISAPKAAAPSPVQTARSRTRPPVASYKVPQTIPQGGAPYTIRWGDTLWDISEAFYRNPWLYRRIAQFNDIRNPDRIISGRTIRIPPR